MRAMTKARDKERAAKGGDYKEEEAAGGGKKAKKGGGGGGSSSSSAWAALPAPTTPSPLNPASAS